MATPATIAALVAAAQAQALTPLQMVAVIDYAIACAIADQQYVVRIMQGDGELMQMNFEEARALRELYIKEYRISSSPVSATPEFNFFGSNSLDGQDVGG